MADNQKLTCPICGESTVLVYGKYPRKDGMCKRHSLMVLNKEIEQCSDCGKWNKAGESCTCKTSASIPPKKLFWEVNTSDAESKPPQNIDNTLCVVCANPSNGKMQCKNCYNETKDFMESLDKNNSVRKFRDYYYNLKERILIIKSLEEAQRQCNKLIAIAMVDTNIHDDTSLFDRVYKDVETLLKSKKAPVANDKYEEERKENDEHKSKVKTAQDGHVVDSDMEVHIDDVLYNAYILHCYGKSVEEITEKRKKCDWFIPIVNDEGIYIEYWGMKTPKYLAERKEKEELYQKYNIPYISIEADDPKQDTQTFKSNLIRDLTKLAVERFGFMPKWKK